MASPVDPAKPRPNRSNGGKGARMARTQSLAPLAALEGGLTRYLDEIRRFPMLEPQEEYMLAKRYRDVEGDREEPRDGPEG